MYTAFRADIIQRMYVATLAQLIPIYDAQMTLVTEHKVDHVVQSSHKVIIGVFVLVMLLRVIPVKMLLIMAGDTGARTSRGGTQCRRSDPAINIVPMLHPVYIGYKIGGE